MIKARLGFLHRSAASEESFLAIQYVWLQDEPAGARWANPFLPKPGRRPRTAVRRRLPRGA